MTSGKYTAGANGADAYYRKSVEIGPWCVNGPGNGFGYYSYALYPSRQFETLEIAEVVAKMCDDAFKAGVADQKHKVLTALGLK